MRGTSLRSLSPHQSSIQGSDVGVQQLLGLFLRDCCPLRRGRRVRTWLCLPRRQRASHYTTQSERMSLRLLLMIERLLPRIISILLHDKIASHPRGVTLLTDFKNERHNIQTRELSSLDNTEVNIMQLC